MEEELQGKGPFLPKNNNNKDDSRNKILPSSSRVIRKHLAVSNLLTPHLQVLELQNSQAQGQLPRPDLNFLFCSPCEYAIQMGLPVSILGTGNRITITGLLVDIVLQVSERKSFLKYMSQICVPGVPIIVPGHWKLGQRSCGIKWGKEGVPCSSLSVAHWNGRRELKKNLDDCMSLLFPSVLLELRQKELYSR